MTSSSATGSAAARALLRREAAELRGLTRRPLVFGLAATLCGIAGAWFTARLLSALLGWPGAGWPDLAAAGLFALGAAASGYAQERAQLATGEAARARLRGAVLSELLELAPGDPRSVGERASLVVDRVEALDGYFARWLPAATLAALAPACVLAAAFAADLAAFTVLLAAGLLYPLVMALSGFGAAQASRSQFDALQRLSGRFLDRLRGLPTLVLFGREEAEAAALGRSADELRVRTLRVLRLAFLATTALELLSALAIALLAWHHAAWLGAGGGDPTAAIFALLLVPAFFAPLRAFSAAYHERLSAEGAATALAPLLLPDAGPPGLLLEGMPDRVVVAFSDVRLVPDPARPPALDGMTFRVNAGETLVLNGPSGAGKTSVLRLLMGFARPDGGRVAINGQDATALRPSELRRLSAYIGQRPHLFRASLRENIRLAAPEAPDRAVEDAARAARVTDFADTLPRGLDTVVGEGGWGLSAGQAQRVALARAFLRNAPLVLLDEPTAHLDPGTEAEVVDSLRRLCMGRTAVIATHSAAFRASWARVLPVEDGRAAGAPRQVRRGG